MLVDQWMMKSSMNEVDAEVGKEEKQWELKVVVEFERLVLQ